MRKLNTLLMSIEILKSDSKKEMYELRVKNNTGLIYSRTYFIDYDNLCNICELPLG